MSATQKKAPAKKAAAKKASKKAPAKKAAPKQPNEGERLPGTVVTGPEPGRSLGETLVKLIARAEKKDVSNAKVKSFAEQLSTADTLKHSDLLKLRDEVNATAADLREKEERALAREFSMANRLVRRLERSAR